MQITVDALALRGALKKVQPATQKKTTLPILSHLLLEVRTDPDRLVLRGTDLNVSVEAQVPAELPDGMFAYPVEAGAGCPPGKLFCDIVADLKSGPVGIAFDEEQSRTTITRPSKSSSYTLDSLRAEEFPSSMGVDQTIELMTAEDVLGGAIARALMFVAGGDEVSRAALNGVRFTVDRNGLTHELLIEATDGRRCYRERVPLLSAKTDELRADFLLHGDSLRRVLPSLSGPVRVRAGESSVEFTSGAGTCLLQALQAGGFPDIGRVIGFDTPYEMTIDREAFCAAIGRALRTALETTSPNLLEITIYADELTITSHTPSKGSGREVVKHAQWTGPEGWKVAVNGSYLLDCIGVYGGDEIEFGAQDGPHSSSRTIAILGGPGFEGRRAVFMPVRLREAVPAEEVPADV